MSYNFSILNVRGLSSPVISAAVESASKVVEPEVIKEIWLLPLRNMVYIAVGDMPCVGVPHDFGTGATPCL